MTSILDAILTCTRCGAAAAVRDCEPDVDGDGALGCPRADCGGVMAGTEKANQKSKSKNQK